MGTLADGWSAGQVDAVRMSFPIHVSGNDEAFYFKTKSLYEACLGAIICQAVGQDLCFEHGYLEGFDAYCVEWKTMLGLDPYSVDGD